MRILFTVATLVTLAVSPLAHAEPTTPAAYVRGTCAQSIETFAGQFGKEYSVIPTRLSTLGDRLAVATQVLENGQWQTKLSVIANGQADEMRLPSFDFKAIALAEDSVWFLSDDSIREYSLRDKQIVGTYPSFPRPFEVKLTTRARGITYHGGYLYIAHGALGVAMFDARQRQHYTVRPMGLQPGSLAAAVALDGRTLYLLQGAYSPNGFNGVSIVDLASGATKSVAYAPASGVVDAYTSRLALTDQFLMINNGGWIHGFLLSNLRGGASPQAPTWLPISEKIETDGGVFEKFLMVEGDIAVVDHELLACSSVSYVPTGQRRPVTEWRFLQRKL